MFLVQWAALNSNPHQEAQELWHLINTVHRVMLIYVLMAVVNVDYIRVLFKPTYIE